MDVQWTREYAACNTNKNATLISSLLKPPIVWFVSCVHVLMFWCMCKPLNGLSNTVVTTTKHRQLDEILSNFALLSLSLELFRPFVQTLHVHTHIIITTHPPWQTLVMGLITHGIHEAERSDLVLPSASHCCHFLQVASLFEPASDSSSNRNVPHSPLHRVFTRKSGNVTRRKSVVARGGGGAGAGGGAGVASPGRGRGRGRGKGKRKVDTTPHHPCHPHAQQDCLHFV